MFFPSSSPSSYNLYHHGPLTCKSCSMKSWVLYDTSASLDNEMDHVHVFYRYCTMVLLWEKVLVALFPCIVRMLGTCSCDVLLSYMWYTKQILFSLFSYSGLVGMRGSLDPPSTPIWLDMSFDTGSLLVVGLPVETLPKFETFFVSKGTSDVIIVSSQRDVYISCES
jgi:hypothetical protein